MDVNINLPEETPSMDSAYANKTRPQPCDTQTDLYALQPEKLFKGGKPDSVKGKHNCNANILGSRPCERYIFKNHPTNCEDHKLIIKNSQALQHSQDPAFQSASARYRHGLQVRNTEAEDRNGEGEGERKLVRAPSRKPFPSQTCRLS